MEPEVTSVDTESRCVPLLLLGFAVLWLAASGLLGLVASVQLLKPAFLSDCPFFTYGRTVAMAESSFVYGWLANAGLALALWILARLGGEPLRARNWAIAGAVFWNLGVAGALVGVATGDRTGFDLLELPGYVQPVMLFSYASIAIPGILAWSGRSRPMAYAAQWYASAALFLFPWFFGVAEVMLFRAPARGVLQAIIAGWYAQAAWTLWIAPLALSVAYYVIPKIAGRTVRSYEFAALGFWSLLFLGAWTGGRHLIGGPVPAWIPAVGLVTSGLLVFHYLAVFLNLQDAFGLKGVAGRFIAFGLMAYLISAVADFLTAFQGVALTTHFTFVETAQRQLALYGAASMILFGGLYYALPRLSGRVWASGAFVKGHMILMVVGVIMLVVSLAVAGFAQGAALLDPKASFETIAASARSGLIAAAGAQVVLLIGNLLLLLNYFRTICCLGKKAPEAVFATPPADAAPAS